MMINKCFKFFLHKFNTDLLGIHMKFIGNLMKFIENLTLYFLNLFIIFFYRMNNNYSPESSSASLERPDR